MLLSEFVSETIREIRKGVQSAINSSAYDSKVNPKEDEVVYIEFDVAIHLMDTSKTNASGKAGIKVASFIDVGGGVNKEDTSQRKSEHRVKFPVPVSYGKNTGTRLPFYIENTSKKKESDSE